MRSAETRRLRHTIGDAFIRGISPFCKITEKPLFVLGNQKSGTTVIAALLAKHTGLTATLDFRYPSEVELGEVQAGRMSLERFVQRRALHFSRSLIKEPELTVLYEPLSIVFPDANFVMVMRDPRDNIRSLLNRVDIPGNLEDIPPEYLDTLNLVWRRILKGDTLGLKGSNYIDALALRWNDAAKTYLTHRKNIHLIRYEDFNADKAQSIVDLAKKLGLPRKSDITAEVDVQYQGRGNRDIAWLDFFGEHNVRMIEKRSGRYLREFGYDRRTM